MLKELLLPLTLLASDPQLACLTEAIYFEGRSEPLPGQMAIANVVLNRVKSTKYPDNVCGVVHERHQFSYFWDGKPETIHNEAAYKIATNIASLAISGATITRLRGATHYHATYVNPEWSARLDYTTQIGKHKFYRENP